MKKLGENVVKQYKDKIKQIQDELNNANKDLEETEKEYKQLNVKDVAFQMKVENFKTKKESLENEIKDYEVKITEMNELNKNILMIIEKLKSDILGYGKEVANFKKSFNKEKLVLQNKIQELEKQNEQQRREIIKKNEDIAKKEKENEALLFKLQLALKKNQETESYKHNAKKPEEKVEEPIIIQSKGLKESNESTNVDDLLTTNIPEAAQPDRNKIDLLGLSREKELTENNRIRDNKNVEGTDKSGERLN